MEHILDATDPSIQIAFINTLIVIEQRYPKSSIKHYNELFNLGKHTSKYFHLS